MKNGILVITGLGLLALCLSAAEGPADLDARHRKFALDWNDAQWWQRNWSRDELKMSVGSKEFSVKGPLIETFRAPRRSKSDLSLGEKISHLPIINLFVPQPMPRPPGGEGRYLAWGEKSIPWSAVADRGSSGPVGLVSVNW